jgi:uncharacterized membrane protein
MNKRLSSIDLLRGVVMVLMAIDHVRVYSGISAGGPNPGIFFTRWITHFCVPAFVFFAGTGAWLQGSKTGDKAALSRFLLVRGALLVVLELTLIRFCWTFNLDYGNFTLAGVIWMLGWCMILLAAVIRLPVRAIGILGLGIIFLQQLFAYPSHWLPDAVRPLWEFIYPGGAEPWKGLSILYTLVPWIGVMAAGYAFGVVMQLEAGRRRRICLWIGLSATALFLIIGTILVFSHPAPEKALPPVLRLLNQTKYPASQLYLMMTLGPIIALLPWAERAKGWLVNILLVFGRVPLFFYLCHILLIHCSALLVNLIRTGSTHQAWYATAPYDWIPEPDRWPLGLLYLVWLIDVIILYVVCRWYSRYKGAHPEKMWLKYI